MPSPPGLKSEAHEIAPGPARQSEDAGEGAPRRVPELDGLRGVAIGLVLIWHYGVNLLPPGPARRICERWLWFFWSGVDLFFVLSGFLIAGILLDHARDQRYFSTFFVRRACRIFPVYYLTLACCFIASSSLRLPGPADAWLWGDRPSLWPYLTFLQNWSMAFGGSFGPSATSATWSLAVEEQFYLILPLMIAFISRRNLLGLTIVSILAAPAMRLILDQRIDRLADFVLLPGRIDSLAWGVGLAIWVRSAAARSVLYERRVIRRLCLAGIWIFIFSIDGDTLPGQYVNSLLSMAYGLLLAEVLASQGAGPIAGVLRFRMLRWLGLGSFSLYLFHQPLLGLIHGLVLGRAPALGHGAANAATLLAFLATCLLAALSYRFIETPWVRLGHRRSYE